MKEKEDLDKEKIDIDSEKPLNINDLTEPLVEEKNPKNSKKKISIHQSVNLSNNNNYEPPIQTNKFLHNSINANNLNNNSNNPINRIRKEINELNKDNETEISNYSNTPGTQTIKFQNFIFIIIITIFSSLQFGIYIFIFNLYLNSMNTPTNSILGNNINNINNLGIPKISNKGLLYAFFLVLSWKYQIYFIIYLIYATYIYFKYKNVKKIENKNNDENINEDSAPLLNRSNSLTSQNSFINSFPGNPTFKFREFKYKYLNKCGYSYDSYFNIFLLTSNIFDIQENDKNFCEYYFNINELIKGLTGIFFAYSLLVGSYFYYFGIIYLIQEITALLPYYIQYNTKTNSNSNNNNNIGNKLKNLSNKLFKESNNGEYYKYIFPILMAIGFYYLQKTIINYSLFLFILLICSIGLQIINQKKFVLNSHDESPFQILFRTYFNYAIISLAFVFIIEIIFNGFHIRNLFYWLTDIKIFLASLIGFGICGAICYNMLILFMRISLSNNIIIKLIKYFNLIIIDIVGIFLFRQYIIASYLDYIVGLSLCGVSMFLLDFHRIL